jgi:drug/metabolite transporter (DMT)-like permease
MKRSSAMLAPLFASILWGGMYVVSKWSLPVIAPVTLSLIRITVGSVSLLIFVWFTKPNRSIPWRDWIGFSGLGLLVTITLVGQLVGTDLTNASQGSIFTMATPIFTVFLGVQFLDEQTTIRKIGGIAVAVLGVFLIVNSEYSLNSVLSSNFLGIGVFFFSSLAWAGFTVFGKPLIRRYSPLETAAYAAVTSVPITAVLLPLEWSVYERSFSIGEATPAMILALLYLGIMSTAVAWFLWYTGVEQVSAGTVSVYLFAQPAVGVALGAILLNEAIGPMFLLGAVVMSVGIYFVSTEREPSNPEQSREATRP